MSVYETKDNSGKITGAYDTSTRYNYSPEEYAKYKIRVADSRRLLQAMDYRRGGSYSPLPTKSRVPNAAVPEARSVYEVSGGGGGGAKVKRVVLSSPLPKQASSTDARKKEEKPRRLKAKGDYLYYEMGVTLPGKLDLDLFEENDDGSPDKLAAVPAQIAVEISVVKGVDYIGIANSTKGRSQDVGGVGTAVKEGTYDLGAVRDISDSIFVGFYKMDFGD